MQITIPKLSLVVLIGPSGSGKSTFARKHFLPTEVLSSDACRGMVSDDENDQAVTNDAFEVLHFIAAKRLALGRLTVVDATNVQPEARKPLVELARQYHCLPVAIVLNLPERLCQERNRDRPDRDFGPHVVRQQQSQLRRSLRGLEREGFRHVFVLETPGGGRSGRRSSGCRCGTTSGTSTARSTSSATFTAAATSWRSCSSGSATVETSPGRRRSRLGQPGLRPPRGPQGRLRRRPGGPWPAHPRHGAAGAEHGPPRLGPVRARQPRHEAAAEAAGQGRPDHARAGRHASPRSTPCRTTFGSRSARSWPSSSTAWSATTSSTTASWSSPTPG